MDLKLASDEAGGLEAEVVEEQEGRSLSEGTKLYNEWLVTRLNNINMNNNSFIYTLQYL